MNPTTPITLVPYGRTSREKGRTKEQQERDYREAVEREFANKPNVTLLPWTFDHGKTGGKLAGRDGLVKALELLREGKADGLVVPQAKRLGRNLRE